MPNVTARMFGEPMLEPVFLRVPPASLNALALLDQKMGAKGLGYHYSAYLTRISFVQVDGKGQPLSYPQMQFYAVRPLTKEELLPVLDLRKDPQCQRITGEAGTHGGARAIAGPTSSNVNLGAFTGGPQKQIEGTVNPPSQAPAVGQSTAPAATKAAEPEEETGFGSTTAAVTTKSPSEASADGAGEHAAQTTVQSSTPATAITTVADTGEPEESDAELDARIAGIINKAK